MRLVLIGSLFLFAVTTAFGQVGINNENPEADLDVKGNIRMRGLGNPIQYNRMILADEEGNLGYNDVGAESYIMRHILFKSLTQGVSTQLSNATGSTNIPVDLGLDIVVKVDSRTSVAVALEYNIPITSVTIGNSTDISGFYGATLFRKENNVQTEIEEGSRKFALYNVPVNYGTNKHIVMPVSGKAVDMVVNLTSQEKYVTYSVRGYVENGRGTTWFGNFLTGANSYGDGIFVIHMYEKRL